ncbi:MAG: glycogen synthase GlgA [Abitibacteriaceae bacterium]|nr:glycogen synthase GlgA [Abditibacteriaceae bacterium]MBV9866526.1 glycogen synthase GlgA [Abditibacteriaceae bacterium]
MADRLKVLMVTAEAVPFIKTGGLADVAGSLPHALAAQDIDVRLVLPHYKTIDATRFRTQDIAQLYIPFDDDVHLTAIQQVTDNKLPPANNQADVPVYFIDAPHYFGEDKPYGYDDDILRFGFFVRACLELPGLLEWQPDIIHCHDWHTGLLPVYLSTRRRQYPALAATKTVFTIHNLAYQGESHSSYLPRLGLDPSLFNYHQLEFYGKINPMKGGLVFADTLTAVSPGYAHEIQTAEYGAGLEGLLQNRAGVLHGILNGIDYSEWNPRHDPHLAQNYGPEDSKGKAQCKRDLLSQMGLAIPGRKKVPVIGMVSRLSAQKGFDLVADALESLVQMGCYFVLLGSGEPQFMQLFQELEQRFPRAVACRLDTFDNALAHKIYAGSDLFLMPSHYEPCGLAQMISLAYGTIPIVRATGGLADTVHEFDATTGIGNGFVFEPYTASALTEVVQRAVTCYKGKAWPQLMQNGFACDFSWNTSARQYAQLYGSMLSS